MNTMKKACFLICAALLSLAACVKVQPNPDPVISGVNLRAMSEEFVSGLAEIELYTSEAAQEDLLVTLAFDKELSTCKKSNVKFEENQVIAKGTTSTKVKISFQRADLTKGEYSACIVIGSVEGAAVGKNSSVLLKAVVETAWDPVPTFKKVATFPTLIITTDESIPSRRVSGEFPYVTGKAVFNDPDGMYSDVKTLEVPMRIRKRGNTTANNAKCGYKIKLDEKNKVFGMKGDSDWCILAEWSDGTLLRNQTAMQVSRIVGMQWTPKCCGVEVTINGQKQGLFSFFENKEIGDSKIPMSEDGFYLDLDDKEEDSGSSERFTTPQYYKVIKFKQPDWPASDKKDYVKNFFTAMENALASNSTSAEFAKYKQMMNVDSFIRNFIVQELCKNVDGNLRLSTPLVLENDVLRVPMVWDFDLSLGNGEMDGYFPLEDVVYGTATGIRTSRDGDGPTGWFVKCAGGRPYGWENPNGQTAWYQRMFRDPEFVAQLKATWNELYTDLQTVPGYSDVLYDLYKDAIQREWNIWNSQNRSNRSGARKNTPKAQYDAMRKFYVDRLEWMNTAMNKL